MQDTDVCGQLLLETTNIRAFFLLRFLSLPLSVLYNQPSPRKVHVIPSYCACPVIAGMQSRHFIPMAILRDGQLVSGSM